MMPQVARAAVEAGATLLLSSQFIQLYDLYEDRVRYGAINAAVSNGVNVAAARRNGRNHCALRRQGAGGLLGRAAGHGGARPLTLSCRPGCNRRPAAGF